MAAAGRHVEGFEACQMAGLDAVKRKFCGLSGSMGDAGERELCGLSGSSMGYAAEGLASLDAVERALCGLSRSIPAGRHVEGFEACQTAGLDAVKKNSVA